MTTTRETLLHRVRDPQDAAAWEQFFALYAPLLEGYARASGLSAADAEEVRDQCLATIVKRMPDFEYERSRGTFKAWLHRIVRGKVVDARRAARAGQLETDAWQALAAHDDRPDEAWDRRWREEHLRYALARARADEREGARGAVDLLLQDLPVDEIVERTGLNANQVYKARARLLKRVRSALERLGVGL